MITSLFLFDSFVGFRIERINECFKSLALLQEVVKSREDKIQRLKNLKTEVEQRAQGIVSSESSSYISSSSSTSSSSVIVVINF